MTKISIYKHSQFYALGYQAIVDNLCERIVVLASCPDHVLEFSAIGLNTIIDLDDVIEVEGKVASFGVFTCGV